MAAYIIRRVLYGILILIGVNILTFVLFFAVNTPDDIARLNIGGKRVTQEAIAEWKVQHGYDIPLIWNDSESGVEQLTRTIFWERSASLFAFQFGYSDSGRDIGHEIALRIGPSLALQIPVFFLTILVSVVFSLTVVFFRGTYLDFWGVVLCVVMLSISALFYIIAGQWLFAKILRVV
ncbi:MAG: ABC transporter permease, partial [Burkholderiaceae bacterium]